MSTEPDSTPSSSDQSRPDPETEPQSSPSPTPGEPRRDFLQKAGSVVIGGAIVACPAAVGVVALTDPLRRDTGGGVLARLTTREALRPGAPPKVFKVVADRVDAWATTKDVPLGLVYAHQTVDGEVIVFSATCPHAGCAVEYRNSLDANAEAARRMGARAIVARPSELQSRVFREYHLLKSQHRV